MDNFLSPFCLIMLCFHKKKLLSGPVVSERVKRSC